MATTTAGPTLLPSPRQETDQSHGFHYFWLLAAIIVGATAVLATWVISQPDTNTGAGSTTFSGGISPRAADHLDAQIVERSAANTVPLSPRAADFQDAQAQRANSTQPVSPNAIDRLDATTQSLRMSPTAVDRVDAQQQLEVRQESLRMSPTAVDRVDAQQQQQSSSSSSVPVSPNAADYMDQRQP